MSSSTAIRAGRAFVELFALRPRSGQTDDGKLVLGLRQASAKLKAFGESVFIGARLGPTHCAEPNDGIRDSPGTK